MLAISADEGYLAVAISVSCLAGLSRRRPAYVSDDAHSVGSGHHGGLVVEQPGLAVEPAGIAGEPSVRSDDPVTGHDHSYRVAAVGQTDGTRGVGVSNLSGQFAITDRLAVGDVLQASPYPALKVAPGQLDWNVELGQRSVEIGTSWSVTSAKQVSSSTFP